MQTDLFGFLTNRPTSWGWSQAQRGNGDDVRSEPDGDPERQPEAGADLRHEPRSGAVQGADDPAERVVHDRARARLLRSRQLVAGTAGDRRGHLDRRILLVRCRRDQGSGNDRTRYTVAETHRAGPGETSDQADESPSGEVDNTRHSRLLCNLRAPR